MTIAGYGPAVIPRRLNEDGVPVFGSTRSTKEKLRNKSGLWGFSSVQKILHTPTCNVTRPIRASAATAAFGSSRQKPSSRKS
ncbi:hypothetical protein [Pseudomonas sp. DR 5-09]|uniref:hypothetical protein n=1 Tax=Pseudomonas sp. DR 5-09 TaxID=1534110 RepID=UPI003FA77BB2